MAAQFVLEGEPWQQCLAWLTRLGVFPEGTSSSSSSPPSASHFLSTDTELQEQLQDGVLLCKALHLIHESFVDMKQVIVIEDQQFSMVILEKNINVFRTACHNHLGIEGNLFCANDLIDIYKFNKVLQTLSIVSTTGPAMRKLEPFYFSGEYMRDYYIEENLAGSRGDSENLEAVAELENLKANYCLYEVQCLPTSCASHKVHFQLLQSELYYTETLLEERSLRDELGAVLGNNNYKQIFYRFKDLQQLHLEFYHDLRHSFPDNFPSLREAFSRHRLRFFVYVDYCSRYTQNHDLYLKLLNNKDIRKIETNYRVEILLIDPFQRILKYGRQLQTLGNALRDEAKQEDADEVEKARDWIIKLGKLSGAAVEDERNKQHFNESHKLPEDVKNFQGCGRLVFRDSITVQWRRSDTYADGDIHIFEEAVIIFHSTKKSSRHWVHNMIGSRKESEFREYYCTIKVDDLKLKEYTGLQKKVSIPSKEEGKQQIQSFTLSDETKAEGFFFTPKSYDRRVRLEEALENVRMMQIFKQRSEHSFISSTIALETILDDNFCDICANFLDGSYQQCNVCSKCNIKCHKICILAANEVPCQPNSTLELAGQVCWWGGEMSRADAEDLLDKSKFRDGQFVPGLFKMRWSVKMMSLVLSVIASNLKICHILVDSCDEFRLANFESSPSFPSVALLLKHYNQNNINSTLPAIDATLQICPNGCDKDMFIL